MDLVAVPGFGFMRPSSRDFIEEKFQVGWMNKITFPKPLKPDSKKNYIPVFETFLKELFF